MSSIVRKSSHFTPKVKPKKRVVRQNSHATPPASQNAISEEAQTGSESIENGKSAILAAANAATLQSGSHAPAAQEQLPPATQAVAAPESPKSSQPNPLFLFSILPQKPARPAGPDTDTDRVVDPMQKMAAPAEASEADNSENSDSEDYGDNDIFKHMPPKDLHPPRRPSVAGHRRLSVAHPNRRQSLILGAGTPALGGVDDVSRAVPMQIEIPQGKPSKRRPSVGLGKQTAKKQARGLVISIPVTVTAVPEQPAQEESQNESRDAAIPPVPAISLSQQTTGTLSKASKTIAAPVKAAPKPRDGTVGDGDYVVGVDPKTQRLRKYRVSEDVEDSIPVAPEGLVTSIGSIKQLPRKIDPAEEHLYAGVHVQADAISMADLCKPTIQIGAKSDNFAQAEKAKVKIEEKRNQRRLARQNAREHKVSYAQALREITGYAEGGEDEDEGPKKLDFSNIPEESSATSTLKLSLIGTQIQLDQESTVRSRGHAPSSTHQAVEEETLYENPITLNSYSRTTYTDAWTKAEMVELYQALSTWGTDFTFIAQLFPHRTRRQIKNKFTLEEKNNPQLVELALRRKLPADFDAFRQSASTVKNFVSVDDFNKELAELRRDHETHMRQITVERENAIKEDLEKNRQREIEIRTGSKPMTKAERSRMIRQNEVVVGEIEDVKRTREQMDF